MNLNVLDCTIRDGGHLNKWFFPPLMVKASYFAALKSGIDYFEVGYRNPKSIEGLGDFAYCEDEFLFPLFTPSETCKLTIMLDTGKSEANLVQECLPEITPVRAIRIASYPYELTKSFELVEDFKNKGYEVFLNLMAFSTLENEQFEILQAWQSKDLLTAIYFADSFGSFLPSDIVIHFNKLKNIGFKSIGFHSHNNLQLAFANTLKAIEIGASYVDCSIYGMGRGAGNLPIEFLVGYFEKRGHDKYNTMAYLDVIERFYLKYFQELNWGYTINTLMSGMKEIHPYYVDELFRKKSYTIEEIWNILDLVKEKCPISFSSEKMDDALEQRLYTPIDKQKAINLLNQLNNQFKIFLAKDSFKSDKRLFENIHAQKRFLIIANGPSILKYQDSIRELIKNEDVITIGVNFLRNAYIPDYHMFVSRKRFLKHLSSVDKKSKLLIPSFFGKQFLQENYSENIIYFNINSIDNYSNLPVADGIQNIVYLNVGISAILMAYQMGASEIYAVGMDGYVDEMDKKIVYFYNENDVPDVKEVASIRYENFTKELSFVNQFLQEEGILFSIITPTSHKKYFRNLLNIKI